MPEARLERTRALYRENCKHYFMFMNESDVAPSIILMEIEELQKYASIVE